MKKIDSLLHQTFRLWCQIQITLIAGQICQLENPVYQKIIFYILSINRKTPNGVKISLDILHDNEYE